MFVAFLGRECVLSIDFAIEERPHSNPFSALNGAQNIDSCRVTRDRECFFARADGVDVPTTRI